MNSPFNQEQAELLNQLLPSLTDGQNQWLSGYLTASTTSSTATAPAPTVAPLQGLPSIAPVAESSPITKEVTILYGSQTGNCQTLAEEALENYKTLGFDVTLSSMNDFRPNDLKKVAHLLIIVSTQGEGDPPDTAIPFYEFLHGRRAPKLKGLQFSVLSLGDSSYDFYCITGKQFDERLEELGAERLSPRVDCDLDYDEPAAEWFEAVSGRLVELTSGDEAASTLSVESIVDTNQSVYSRTNPYQAEVFENINLNGRGSNKETRHLELSLENSNLVFEPGDSLGIYPENNTDLVDTIINEMNWNAEESITINKQGEQRALRGALRNHYEITVLTKPMLEKIVAFNSHEGLTELLHADNKEALKEYLHGSDLLDIIRDYGPWDVQASEFINVLRKLPARLYSVASSYEENPEEVHLTIGAVRYEKNGRERSGVCSVQCAERVEPGDSLSVYVQKNENFRLPKDPDAPIIMIGPGTGVAPFRAYLEEREATGAEGKSWLFFGDQHYVTDFIYQVEWQRWIKNGVLTKLDVAFSRDTAEKVYVQHRMLENSKELYQWLIDGAYIYVCGDEEYMAKDVHETLLTILKQEGNMESEEASSFLTSIQQQKRYQRDVY